MFENIGSKIKGLATILCVLGVIGSIVLGIVICSLGDFFIAVGLIFMALGGLLSWILSFFMYGFGQLIENSDMLVMLVAKQKGDVQVTKPIDEKKSFFENSPMPNIRPALEKIHKKETKLKFEKQETLADDMALLDKLYTSGTISQEEYEKKMEELQCNK